MNKNCELCELSEGKHRITKLYYEDDICLICNCKDPNCGLPMIVLKRHGKPLNAEIEYLKKISKKIFPDRKWRGYARKIKDHYHQHLIIGALSEIYKE